MLLSLVNLAETGAELQRCSLLSFVTDLWHACKLRVTPDWGATIGHVCRLPSLPWRVFLLISLSLSIMPHPVTIALRSSVRDLSDCYPLTGVSLLKAGKVINTLSTDPLLERTPDHVLQRPPSSMFIDVTWETTLYPVQACNNWTQGGDRECRVKRYRGRCTTWQPAAAWFGATDPRQDPRKSPTPSGT